MRPGVNVTVRDAAPPSTIPTDVGTGFAVGVTESGAKVPTSIDIVQNFDEYKRRYAPSGRAFTAGITMYDSVDMFFAEGGNRLYVGRVLGPAAVEATVDLKDNAAATALTVSARGPGEWGNNVDVRVLTTTELPAIPAGSFRIRLIDETTSAIIEESPDLADTAAAIAWGTGSQIVKVAAGASLIDPVAGTFDLVGGAVDTAGIVDASWQTAVDSLSYALGPGILFAPGATTDSIHDILAEGARRDLRVAFIDGPDTPTATNLITSVKAVSDTSLAHARFAGLFAPWLLVAGVATGTTRKVPPSASVAGVFARNMGAGHSANEPAAGELGRFRQVVAFTQTYNDADRQLMNANGVNVCRDIYGVFKVYGWRTTADPINDPRWIALSNSLLHRQIVAEAGAVGERFVFRQIDGQGRLFGELAGALIGEVCLPLYLAGSLYGATPDEAYKVDTGPSVNTIATIANNELHAVISIKMAPFGEEVNIEVVKYLVNELIPV